MLPETDVTRIVEEAEARRPAALIVDSMQAVQQPAMASSPGTVSQVRAVGRRADALREGARPFR